MVFDAVAEIHFNRPASGPKDRNTIAQGEALGTHQRSALA